MSESESNEESGEKIAGAAETASEQPRTEEPRKSAKTGLNFCPECGSRLAQPDKFCPHCGRPLPDAARCEWPPDAKPNGACREEDFIAFVGNNSPSYLEKFRKFRVGGVDNFSATWHWPVFFTGFWWMLYRKMYLWAAVSFIGLLIPYVNFVAWIGFALAGNYIYYKFAQRKILALRSVNPQGDISVTLAQIGGVNRWIPIVAIIITLLALALAMIAGLMSALTTHTSRYI